MVDSRKIYALVVLLCFAGIASAQQPLSCNATASVPPTLRSEGFTELVGDIVLDCTGGTSLPAATAMGAANLVNFTIFTSAPITSRVSSTTLPAVSEALLLVDEPGVTAGSTLAACNTTASACLTQVAAGPLTNGFSTATYNGAATHSNVFYGISPAGAPNQLQFLGVPLDPPGSSGHRIFRFTNIRVNANGVSAGISGLPGAITALVGISGSTSIPINNPTQTVGFVQNGMTFTVRSRGTSNDVVAPSDIAFAQCTTLSNSPSSAPFNSFALRFAENFPTAFKTRGSQTQSTPGAIYNTESGFTSPLIPTLIGSQQAGFADWGTRLKASFTNIPAGVSVYVSTTQVTASTGTAAAQLVLNESGQFVASTRTTSLPCNSTASSLCSGSQDAFLLPVTNGTAVAVWEVTAANALATENFQFGIWFAYTANPGQNSPPAGTARVTGSFAPTPSGLGITASSAAGVQASFVPRFAEGSQSSNVFSIYTCRTSLLFPFVTNQSGFDTGLAISNTSADPFGTTTQAGTCTLNPYGANAPASFSTASIAAGTTTAVLASTVMPNFQGYVIATCQFQYAHGFAFVSDFGARNIAMGYLALIIPDPGAGSRAASGFDEAGPGAGEQLGQ